MKIKSKRVFKTFLMVGLLAILSLSLTQPANAQTKIDSFSKINNQSQIKIQPKTADNHDEEKPASSSDDEEKFIFKTTVGDNLTYIARRGLQLYDQSKTDFNFTTAQLIAAETCLVQALGSYQIIVGQEVEMHLKDIQTCSQQALVFSAEVLACWSLYEPVREDLQHIVVVKHPLADLPQGNEPPPAEKETKEDETTSEKEETQDKPQEDEVIDNNDQSQATDEDKDEQTPVNDTKTNDNNDEKETVKDDDDDSVETAFSYLGVIIIVAAIVVVTWIIVNFIKKHKDQSVDPELEDEIYEENGYDEDEDEDEVVENAKTKKLKKNKKGKVGRPKKNSGRKRKTKS